MKNQDKPSLEDRIAAIEAKINLIERLNAVEARIKELEEEAKKR